MDVSGNTKGTTLPIWENGAFFVLAVSLLYGIIFNILPLFLGDTPVPDWQALGWEALQGATYAYPLFYLAAMYRLLFLATTLFIFPCSAWVVYSASLYNTAISKGVIASFLVMNIDEVTSFITTALIIITASSLLAAIALSACSMRKCWQFPHRARFCTLNALCLLIVLVSQPANSRLLPYAYLIPLTEISTEKMISYVVKTTQIIEQPFTIANPTQPLTVVLIIGESARADHLHLNGYPRQTTPELEKIPGIVSFASVTSCDVVTEEAVPCIMTGERWNGLANYAGSLLQGFNKAGFYTAWLSNQKPYTFHESTVDRIAREALWIKLFKEEPLFFKDMPKDDRLLPFLDQILAQNRTHQLIVLHSYGSHWPYAKRYDKSAGIFLPDCRGRNTPQACTQEELINGYDNTITVTDRFISDVIKRLENHTALLVYVSDHGESLGEKGRYIHGGDITAREQRHIPMLWWASPSFAQQHRPMMETVKRHNQEPLDQFVIFHSLLDCAGIESPVINKKRSLCRNR